MGVNGKFFFFKEVFSNDIFLIIMNVLSLCKKTVYKKGVVKSITFSD